MKTSWKRLLKTKTKDVFKTSSRRRHQDECLLGCLLVSHLERFYIWKNLCGRSNGFSALLPVDQDNFGFDVDFTQNVFLPALPFHRTLIFVLRLKNVQLSLFDVMSLFCVFIILLTNRLTDFMPLISFYTPWKHQKTKGFLMFSAGMERDQWHEVD